MIIGDANLFIHT